jgi:putative transposase
VVRLASTYRRYGYRRITADDVLQVLADLVVEHGPPDHVRSDNGPEFAAKAVRNWLGQVGVKTLFIESGSPWENGYNESFMYGPPPL